MTTAELLPQPAHAIRPSDNSRKILIVDDDADVRAGLSLRLTQLGYSVMAAGDGKSGLRAARLNRIDLVILDLKLPDADGLEICAELTDDPTTCLIPVIVLSATSDENIVLRARKAGSRCFIRKPYDPNVLLCMIEAALKANEPEQLLL